MSPDATKLLPSIALVRARVRNTSTQPKPCQLNRGILLLVHEQEAASVKAHFPSGSE